MPMDQSYADLVRHILYSFDTQTEIAERHNGGSLQRQGRLDAYEGLLCWLQGYEGTGVLGGT